MNISTKYRIKFWIKSVIIGVGYSCLVASMFHFMNKFIPVLNFNSIYVLIIGIIISICVPFFVEYFYKNGNILPSKYKYIEELFETDGNYLIIEKFGKDTFNKLYQEDLNQINLYGIETCCELLKNNEIKPELKFYLHAKLAKYQLKEDQKNKAIDNLKIALSISQTDFIVYLRLSEIYERKGNAEESIFYIMKAIPLITKNKKNSGLIKYLNNQIQRIKIEGPRKDPPMSGFRHMSY